MLYTYMFYMKNIYIYIYIYNKIYIYIYTHTPTHYIQTGTEGGATKGGVKFMALW